jgi:hypothetical protein
MVFLSQETGPLQFAARVWTEKASGTLQYFLARVDLAKEIIKARE